MAAFAIKSSAVRWIEDSEIMVASLGRELIAEHSLSRLHMREQNRLVGHLDTTGCLARHGKGRSREVARFREIDTEMRAAGILAPQGGKRNDAAHFAERA